jgi:glucose uptake protein GlcU
MDKELPAPAPQVDMLIAGRVVSVPLTRRLFLSYLFSYLVIVSFGLCFALVAINSLSGSIEALHAAIVRLTSAVWPWFLAKGVVGVSFAFAFASMVISTLHGVFFLNEKIHQP